MPRTSLLRRVLDDNHREPRRQQRLAAQAKHESRGEQHSRTNWYNSPTTNAPCRALSRSSSRSSLRSKRASTSRANEPTRPSLPFALLDIVVDHILGDIHTLKNVSLTCHYLREKTLPHLFRRIKLHAYPAPSADSLLLSSSRRIFPYIEHVTLCSIFRDDAHFHGDRPDMDALHALINLQSLTSITLRTGNMRAWSDIPITIQQAIKTCIRSKRLSKLDIGYLTHFPIYLLNGCTSMRDLIVGGDPSCSPRNRDEAVTQQVMALHAGPPASLERLSLTCSFPSLVTVIRWLTSGDCTLDITRLKSLEIRGRGGKFDFRQHQEALQVILNHCGPTLEKLHLDVFGPGPDVNITSPAPGTAFNLPLEEGSVHPSIIDTYTALGTGSLGKLRQLSLRFGIPDLADSRQHTRLLSEVLKNVQKSSRLTRLSLHLSVPDLDGLTVHALQHSWRPWQELDQVLGGDSSNRAPLARRVEVDLCVPALERFLEAPETVFLMQPCLPKLAINGALRALDRMTWAL